MIRTLLTALIRPSVEAILDEQRVVKTVSDEEFERRIKASTARRKAAAALRPGGVASGGPQIIVNKEPPADEEGAMA